MLTFGQVKKSTVANVASVNVDDQQFADYVNDAVRQLMNIGNWWGTVEPIIGAVIGGCITWPKKVDTILGMEICKTPIPLANVWYSFIPVGDQHRDWACRWHRGQRPGPVEFLGTSPLFVPVNAARPVLLQFTCDNPADVGQTVTVYGLDASGAEVFATRPDGSSQRGYVFTLGYPTPVMPFSMIQVSAIVKTLTIGIVRAWNVTLSTGAANIVGIFGGGQTSPRAAPLGGSEGAAGGR